MASLNEKAKFVGDSLEDCHDMFVDQSTVSNIIQLLDNELTVPFIARYRKNITGAMDADGIRKIQQAYGNMKKVQSKINNIIKKLGPAASTELLSNLRSARSVEEVQEWYAPFKTSGKGTYAERARKIGLDDVAKQLLCHQYKNINLSGYINNNTKGLKSISEIQNGIQNIIADMVAKDQRIINKMKAKIEHQSIFINSKAFKKGKELDKKQNFTAYFDFRCHRNKLKSHAMLALNRGEAQKILSVKLEIAENTRNWIINWIKDQWLARNASEANKMIISKAVDDSFKRLIETAFLRKIRTKMNKKAELDALAVFYENLKHLLLVAPVKNKAVLSIDPGFSNGCKVAVINKTGQLLETAVIFPFNTMKSGDAALKLITLVQKYKLDLIALGNGTACRETEAFISDLIQAQSFKPFKMSYSIVSECGASIYSVAKNAVSEFGGLDPNLISAVSIGRRLQDPLLELHKIDPKHLGVGMYQHDLDDNLLNGAVDVVIEDCVSFVGVDLNACSADILRRVSGITVKQAEAVIKYRNENGDFVNRQQLRNVKGIGDITFRNCAGFVRIIPKHVVIKIDDEPDVPGNRKRKLTAKRLTASKKQKLENNTIYEEEDLDRTWIHPESYLLTHSLLKELNANTGMIGSKKLKNVIKENLSTDQALRKIAERLCTDQSTLQLILDGLQQPPDYDIRTEFEQPAFRTGITRIEHLQLNQKITGFVLNTTSFGVFVDVGVSANGLIHRSKIPSDVSLGPGDRVECTIDNIDLQRKRIGFVFKKKLSVELTLK